MFGFFSNSFNNLKETVAKTTQALVGNVVDSVAEEEEFSEFVLDDMEDLEDDDKQNNNLAGHTFDMIALVDSVSLSRTSEAAIQVQVAGRDLMKLLTDDNRMYFPNSVTKGTYNIWDNNQTQRPRSGDMAGVTEVNGSINNQLQQLPNGALNIFNDAAVNGYTIDFVLKTIISHCANVSIAPDNLFNAWGNRRTRFSNIRPKGGKV